MTKSSYLDELLFLRESLQTKSSSSNECSVLNKEFDNNIPDELCSFLNLKHKNFSLISEVFQGCDALAYEDVLKQYNSSPLEYSFIDSWARSDNLDSNERNTDSNVFFMEDNLDGLLNKAVAIDNIRTMLPLLEFESNFVVYNLDEESEFSGLIYISQDGIGSMLAPNFLSYIDDLIDGLKAGRYFVNAENELIFPSSWHYKMKLKAGSLRMDEYGEIIDSLSDGYIEEEKIRDGFFRKWFKNKKE